MEVIIAISAIASILSALSTIRKNRRQGKGGGGLVAPAVASTVKWPFNPVDLIDGIVDLVEWVQWLVHWAWESPFYANPEHYYGVDLADPGLESVSVCQAWLRAAAEADRVQSEEMPPITATKGPNVTGDDLEWNPAPGYVGSGEVHTGARPVKGILDIGRVVDRINGWLKQAEVDGHIEIRVLIPQTRKTGEQAPESAE